MPENGLQGQDRQRFLTNSFTLGAKESMIVWTAENKRPNGRFSLPFWKTHFRDSKSTLKFFLTDCKNAEKYQAQLFVVPEST